MKTNLLPVADAADGSEEVIINQGTGAAQATKRMSASLLAQAGTRPTPDELQAALLGALIQGANITITSNADGTVSIAVEDSPTLTGVPKAPTAAPGTNTTQIATTAFVKAAADVLNTAIAGKQGTLHEGTGITITDNGDGTFTIAATGGGTASALADGTYGDITVSGGGTIMRVTTVTNGTVTVPDEAYGATWSTKLSVPTKNSLYNKFEALTTTINGKVASTAVGVANGVASLDGTGKVPAAQLPSYVDDVLEFSSSAAFPNPGETGKIYVALDTNAQWRWTGTAYVQLVASPGTTDAVPEGSTNKYYTDVRVRAAVMTGLASTTGTPAATDSLLTVLGKLYRQAFGGQLLPNTSPVATGDIRINEAATAIRTLFFLANNAYAADIALQADNVTIKHNATTAHRFDVSGSQKFTVTASGVSVAGNAGASIFFTTGNAGAVQIGPRDGTGGIAQFYSPVSNDLRIWLAGDVMQITSTLIQANVPIVGAGFDATYNVAFKQSRAGQVGYHMYNAGGVAEWLLYQPAHASGDDFRIATFVGGNTSDRFKIGADGTVTVPGNINAGNVTYTSDARLKTDIRPLEGDGAAVLALEPTRYVKDGREQIGFIAQAVEEVIPEAVLTADDEMGTKSLDLGPLVAELVARVKFLDAEVARLKAAA